jgi:poly(3-hydroxybutyrate) depolymerase
VRTSTVALVLAATALACGAPHERAETDRPSASIVSAAPVLAPSVATVPSAASSVVAPSPPKIEGEETSQLDVDGHGSAVLYAPIGAAPPRPLVVATHGNFDRPEWQCEVWARVFRNKVFVLCPRGVEAYGSSKDDPRFTYVAGVTLEKEMDADLAALKASPYAKYLADGPPVYASFSLGAILGAAISVHRAADFPALILVEGGLDKIDDNTMHAYLRNGGKRMMFVCAQGGCAGPAKAIANRFVQIGGEALVVDAGQVGHTYDGPVADAVARALPEFLARDQRFDGLFAD